MKDETYIVHLDKYKSIGMHWIALCLNGNNVTYFDSFDTKYVSKEIKKFVDNKNIITSITIQAYDLIMYGFFCIGFIDFMFKGNSLNNFRNLFSSHTFEKNDKVFLDYFFEIEYKHEWNTCV